MLGIYFSGTGNTRHCVEAFVGRYDGRCAALPIEASDVLEQIDAHSLLVIGYPVYFSNAPKILQDFLRINKASFGGKRVFLIATMGLFSGDGAGCAARMLRQYGAEIVGGLHLKMPDSIGDERVLKHTVEANRILVAAAQRKIDLAACGGRALPQGPGRMETGPTTPGGRHRRWPVLQDAAAARKSQTPPVSGGAK